MITVINWTLLVVMGVCSILDLIKFIMYAIDIWNLPDDGDFYGDEDDAE